MVAESSPLIGVPDNLPDEFALHRVMLARMPGHRHLQGKLYAFARLAELGRAGIDGELPVPECHLAIWEVSSGGAAGDWVTRCSLSAHPESDPERGRCRCGAGGTTAFRCGTDSAPVSSRLRLSCPTQ